MVFNTLCLFFLGVLQVVKLGWIFFLVACRTLADLIDQIMCVIHDHLGFFLKSNCCSVMSWNTLIRCKPSVFKNCWVDFFSSVAVFFQN